MLECVVLCEKSVNLLLKLVVLDEKGVDNMLILVVLVLSWRSELEAIPKARSLNERQ